MSSLACSASVRRLQLGAAAPAALVDRLHDRLFDESWLHFGDYDESLDRPPVNSQGPSERVKAAGDSGAFRLTRPMGRGRGERASWFLPFWYRKGVALPFKDGRVEFIFSEHFFEHMFLDEACELFKECERVLAAGGCLRVVVPDADLRTYELPEPVGFTTDGDSWTDPGKHKSRWSIYSLAYVLEWIGFETRGVVYCDRHGAYHVSTPQPHELFYAGCADAESILATDYILRFRNSLIVDAVKR